MEETTIVKSIPESRQKSQYLWDKCPKSIKNQSQIEENRSWDRFGHRIASRTPTAIATTPLLDTPLVENGDPRVVFESLEKYGEVLMQSSLKFNA